MMIYLENIKYWRRDWTKTSCRRSNKILWTFSNWYIFFFFRTKFSIFFFSYAFIFISNGKIFFDLIRKKRMWVYFKLFLLNLEHNTHWRLQCLKNRHKTCYPITKKCFVHYGCLGKIIKTFYGGLVLVVGNRFKV